MFDLYKRLYEMDENDNPAIYDAALSCASAGLSPLFYIAMNCGR